MPRRAIIITGGTVNLGFETARAIATGHYPGSKADPNEYLLVLASRTDKTNAAGAIKKAGAASKAYDAVFRRLDLADLDSVRQFARDWAQGTAKGDYPPIRALLLNAGLQFPGPLETVPGTGLEATFAVNHVGHALLFHLLAPYLDQSSAAAGGAAARVVVTSSGTHDPAQKSGLPDAVYTSAEDLAHPPKDMVNVKGRQRYSSSKLANVLWTYALDRHLRAAGKGAVTANAFDPGLMPGTGLARAGTGTERFLWNRVLPRALPLLRATLSPNVHTAEESGRNLARVAVGDDSDVQGVSGKYYEMRKAIPSSKDSYVEAKQEDLWNWTVQYLAKGDAAEEARFREFR